jgi:uncharacterized protein (TIGR04551 family)
MIQRMIYIIVIIFLVTNITAQENSEAPVKEAEKEKMLTSRLNEEDDGALEQPAPMIKVEDGKPVKYFELYGYFSFGFKYTNNMILNGNNPYLSLTSIRKTKVDEVTGDLGPADSSKEKDLSWSWLKLHLQPVINVAETLEIHTKMSIFGNTAMGADNYTPDTRSNGLLRDAQLRTSGSIIFEGLWGVIDTPLGELKLGRMPHHWGLGILYNDGNSILNQGTGDYLDRIQLTIPVAGFKIVPSFDFASTGLLQKHKDYFIDSSQKDNGYNIGLAFMMVEDDKALLESKILNEQTVFEFGAMFMFSWKNSGSGEWNDTTSEIDPADGNNIDPSKTYTYMDQSGKLWRLGAWANIYHKSFSLKTEFAFITGDIGKILLDDGNETKIKTEMVGVALEAQYRFIPKKFHLSLLTGLASPDDADYVQGDSWNLPGNAVNTSATSSDTKVQNFRFHKNYNMNSTLWNEFLGRFTAGYYASLFGTFYAIDEFKIDLGLTYSMSLKKNNSLGGEGLVNAVEPFVGLDYSNKSGLRMGVKYQLGVPSSGLSVVDIDGSVRSAGLYHFLNIYAGIVF